MTAIPATLSREWLEPDGSGGFASGTAALARTRRYHALLLVAAAPPTERFVLVNGVEAWVETPSGRVPLSSHVYSGDVTYPDGASRIESFEPDPWPRWRFRLEDGRFLDQEFFVSRDDGRTVLLWTAPDGSGLTLDVRPLLSGRDYHGLSRENASFRFEPEVQGSLRVWRPYDGVPEIAIRSNGDYVHDPVWYRNFVYAEERARGLDFLEDLAAPGRFRFDLSRGPAAVILGSGAPARTRRREPHALVVAAAQRAAEDGRRRAFSTRLERAAEDYVVRRADGRTIVAGYPWFTDWGRDAFVAVRGLCLATGRLRHARDILLSWAQTVSEGMLPNRFPDRGGAPEFNSVDASLWYVIAVHEYLTRMGRSPDRSAAEDAAELGRAVQQILEGYARGTRYGIRADSDGLLAAGGPRTQLTWMDARIDDAPVTPRVGKPVEVQALWINALKIGMLSSDHWRDLHDRALEAFPRKFWNEAAGCLFDVVDSGNEPGSVDASVRPNQIFAIGGLPFPILSGGRAARVVDTVEKRLLTPRGLRSLDPADPAYVGRYDGGPQARDRAYHQGTVWPWLLGPFVEAWVRMRGGGSRARREARRRFLEPLLAELSRAGLGHIEEIADGDPPHSPRGCPFQAWSVAEALRLDLEVLKERRPGTGSSRVTESNREETR